jgi:adhesin HecA-like repeat protein
VLRVRLRRGKGDVGDEVAGLEDILALGRVAGDEKEIADGNVALALGSLDVDGGLESGESDVQVGWIGGDAVLLAPRMARVRFSPRIAEQPEPGTRLLQAMASLRK